MLFLIHPPIFFPDDSDCFESVSPLMRFTVKDCDPDTGEPDSDEGYDDEYQLEDLEITFGDFIQVRYAQSSSDFFIAEIYY